jgi:hypothetical protein
MWGALTFAQKFWKVRDFTAEILESQRLYSIIVQDIERRKGLGV